MERFTFRNTGLDYCGHYYIKDKSRQEFEVYMAIFICFATKAVHMQTVYSLTKDNSLDAVKHFCARRGLRKAFYSDSSITFIGSRGEIEFPKTDDEQKNLKKTSALLPTTTVFHGTLFYQERHTSQDYGKRQ